MAYEHRTGRVNSGDVTLFYRVFGKPGGTPIWIGHGSNYYAPQHEAQIVRRQVHSRFRASFGF